MEMKRILMILAAVVLVSTQVSAQIPRLMNYQGVLTDDMGVVVPDGPYDMTFRLYDVPSGGSPLWEETIAVNVSKGIFNTTLGYSTLIDEDFSEPLYLALEIEGGGELSPRRIFTANAYSFSSRAVYGVSNVFPAEGYVGIGLDEPEAPLHIYADISDSNQPALLIQNVGGQTCLDFVAATVTEARIRKASGGDLFFGTVTGDAINFNIENTPVHKMSVDGAFGIGTLSPAERLDVNGALRLGTTANNNAGTIRWTGADFEGYDGSDWQSLTAGGGSSLPSGSSANTLRHNGAGWVAADNLTNNGTNIGINTASPSVPLHVVQPSGQTGIQVDGYDGSWASIHVNSAAAGASPSYVYRRQFATVGYHFIDASNSWNLWLNGNTIMHVEPNGWTTFGGVGLAESMNLPGAIRIGNSSGTNAGSIRYTGADIEGYVGGMWHSLTSGGLPAGAAGQTLRYDGGWVAAGNLYNNGTDVGLGTSSPDMNLHIEENIDGNMGIKVTNTSNGANSQESLIFEDEDGEVAGIRLYDDTSPTQYAGAMAIYNNRPSGSLLFRTGGLDRVSIETNGEIQTYGAGGAITSYNWTNGQGGNFMIYDETGVYLNASMESDANGLGGYFNVTRDGAHAAFSVDGNYAGTENPRVTVAGSTSFVAFDMSQPEDNSVQLPANSITAPEIDDEPGVASVLQGLTSFPITDAVSAALTRSITVPRDGYVLVIASGQGQVGHVNGTTSTVEVGVSDDNSAFPSNQDVAWQLPSGAVTGTYTAPLTVHGLFEVSEGTNTFYFLARKSSVTSSAYLLDTQLTLVYVRTNYGTVSPTLTGGSDVPDAEARAAIVTASDIAAERSASVADNNARIEREVAEMRERLAALEAELKNGKQ